MLVPSVSKIVALTILPLASAFAGEVTNPASACKMAAEDRTWIEHALSNWQFVAREKLKLPPKQLPTVVTFDANCAYTLKSGAPYSDWQATPHKGQVKLPDDSEIPAGVTSFTKSLGSESDAFFVMSLPSVWHAGGVKSGLGVERLMDAVLLHEIMHTKQAYFATPRLEALTKRYSLPEDTNDDSLQEMFEKNPAYVADYEAERDLLFAAAAAPNDAEAKRLAREALAKMRARRARWFVGDAEKWAPIEEVFLTMEGVGQWVGYAWYTDKAGANLPPDVALSEVRRKGRWWSQDQGLALLLTVDRLVPSWQKHAFAADPATAEKLLEMAAH